MKLTDKQLHEMIAMSNAGVIRASDLPAMGESAAELLALRDQFRWRKYPEEAPEDYLHVIGYYGDDQATHIVYKHQYGWGSHFASGNMNPPLYWLPIPPIGDSVEPTV